ncbi:alpha/beta fold hydrolase [Streptomyces sp. NPDC051976]|uniref:alpha/beta fold hydrolase n=1 Tax=Streptomyces sp. NPDC051976 TaxID=3154947 RepID=UPI003436ED0C
MGGYANGARAVVVEALTAWYGLTPEDIADDRPLAELGLTSRDAVALTARLGELAGVRLPATLLWEAPTIAALGERLERGEPGEEEAAPVLALDAPAAEGKSQVAVVGIGCRLPGGVASPVDFWRLLSEGRDAVGLVPEGRWDPFVGEGRALPEDISRYGAFLDDAGEGGIAGFDAEFFGIGAHEAVAMDPQQRLLLEVAREALDHAALSAPALAGSRTGVFVGISGNEYAHLTTGDPASVDAWTPPGAALSIAAGRLSYLLDLRGPSLAVDTACSSSLVAVHLAVRSLATSESDTALAAGVNLLLSPTITLGFQRAGALAADGRCKAFDAAADGMVRGEGCGVVVLKRLADAERDGDRIFAVIDATAVNSDGRSNGLTAPNAEAQRALLTEAYARSATAPAAVDYIEAHGTGTPLGDPIEAGALGAVLGVGRAPDQPLLIGSAKTNLGHLEAAAGITGFIKTVLALHHGEIPPHLHFIAPTPHADLTALGLRVPTGPEPWPRYSGRATAGVSAFGFGGTNAHVTLSEYRANAAPGAGAGARTEQPAVLLLDGPTPERVRTYAGELAHWLATREGRAVRQADLGRTLAGRTGRGGHRLAVVARSRQETAAALARHAAGEPDPHLVTVPGPVDAGPGPVWVFSGYGSQWPGMGRELLSAEPVFAEAVDRMEPLLREQAGISLRRGLEPDADLSSPAVVMPVLYGLQVALAELWKSYGFQPAAVIGHSMGDIAAAVAADELDPASGARVIAVRSRLLARLTGGAMAVVDRPGEAVSKLAAAAFPSVSVAVHASPTQCVVTGSADDVAALVTRITDEGGFARALPVVGAGHSPDVEPLLQEFAWELGAVRHAPPGCRRYSTVLDDPRATAPCDAAYWAANLRRPVRFVQAVRAAAQDGHRVFVEVAPHPTQAHALAETLGEGAAVLPTLRRATDDALTFRSSLAALLLYGVSVPALREELHAGGRIVDVPGPRWRHRRFWAGEAVPEPARVAPAVPSDATPLDRLRHCVASVMGYGQDRLDPDTPLTELGLDSLAAARIRGAVEREFGVVVDPGMLLRRGTLRGVAGLLFEQDPHSRSQRPEDSLKARPQTPEGLSDQPLRHLRSGAAGATPPVTRRGGTGRRKSPLFLAHAAGGTADVYLPLAERLAPSRDVYGFDRLAEPHDVAARAAKFAACVRDMSPNGPWVLGGWSYGGLLAQEAARLLVQHGTVAALVLLDSVLPLPAPPRLTPTDEARRRFRDFAQYVERTYGAPLPLPYEDLAGLEDAEQVDRVIKLLEQAVDLPTAVLEHQRTSYLDLRSGERHAPGPYPGRTLLYRAREMAPHTVRDSRYERADEALGWDAYCTDLSVATLPGHHLSLLDPPVVDTLAELLVHDLNDC